MKRVIEISEVQFRYLKKRIELGVAIEMDKIVWNGRPLDELIEKIRTDIKSLFADYDAEKSCTFGLIDFEHINNIIDNAIKECE